MTNPKSRRMQQTSWYIGSGNITSVFNRKPQPSFEKIKKIYETELYNSQAHLSEEKNRKTLTQQERTVIKNKVRKAIKAQQKKVILRFAILVIVVIGILLLTHYLYS